MDHRRGSTLHSENRPVQPRQCHPAEWILIQAQRLVDHERQLANHGQEIVNLDGRVERLEARSEAAERGVDYFSVVAYCRLKRLPSPDLQTAQAVGKRAARLSRERGLPVGKTTDPRFGEINTYFRAILDELYGA